MTSPNLRTRSAALNFISGLGVTATTIAVAFFTTPMLLRWLGPERYGAVRAASDWFGHLTIIELGFAGALPPLLALALNTGDANGLRRMLAAGIRAYIRVCAIALVSGALITLAITRLVPVSPGLVSDLRTSCIVGLIGLLLFPLVPFRSLVDAQQKGYVIQGALLAQSLVTTALALWFAHARWGITGQFIALLAGQVVSALALSILGSRSVTQLLPAVMRRSDPVAKTELSRLNLPTFWYMMSGRVALLTDNIVVAGLIGPGAVAPLYLTQRLLGLASNQLLTVGAATWAGLAELHALGRHETFNARMLDLTRLVAGLALATLVPIAAFNQQFITHWVGAVSYGGNLVTVLAAANGFMLSLVVLWTWVFSGTGKVRLLVASAMTSSVLNLVVSIIATKTVGIAGPLIGTFVGVAGVSLWYVPILLQRTFGTPAGAILRAAALPLVWGLPIGAALAWFSNHHPPGTWAELILEMAASGLFLLLFWWGFALTHEERESFRSRAAVVLKR